MNETVQTAAPAPCTFISTSHHYKADGNVRTDKYQRCRKNTAFAPGQNLRDPMYKLFVVSIQSFHILSVHYFDSVIREKDDMFHIFFSHFIKDFFLQ